MSLCGPGAVTEIGLSRMATAVSVKAVEMVNFMYGLVFCEKLAFCLNK